MFDVLIVGAGMVGASLACALGDKNCTANRDLKVGIIESNGRFLRGEFTADGRASAIAYGSSQIWQNIGVWGGMQRRGVTPMHQIQVSEGDSSYQVQLRCEDMGQEALGYIVENSVTLASLWEFAKECENLELICPAQILAIEYVSDRDVMRVKISSENDGRGGEQYLETKLLVGADGGRSLVRQMANIQISERLYDQTCIVTTIQSENSHQNFAYERFQASGPFAILPLGSDRACIVWTATKEETPVLLALDEATFLQELAKRFGAPLMQKLGNIKVISSDRGNYSPRWMHSQTYIQPRLALIGDAAHTTHPIAGQGMNLGIRDVNALANVLKAAHQDHEDLGAIGVLKRYEAKRKWDNLGVIWLTDISNRLFSNHNWFFKVFRRLGLLLLQISPLKRILMYFMMGLHQV